MTNTQTQSGQRPPNATCKYCGRTITYTKLEGWHDPLAGGDDAIWRGTCDANDKFAADHEPADALDAAPARLTPEQWQEAVTRAADALYSYEGLEGLVSAGDPSDFAPLATDAMYAAFPQLAPNPED